MSSLFPLPTGWRAPRPIFSHRDLSFLPRPAHRIDDTPAIHYRVTSHRENRIPVQDRLEHLTVGRQSPGTEIRPEMNRIQCARIVRAIHIEPELQSIRIEPDQQVI